MSACLLILVAIALIFDYIGLFVLGWSITQEEEFDMKTMGEGLELPTSFWHSSSLILKLGLKFGELGIATTGWISLISFVFDI